MGFSIYGKSAEGVQLEQSTPEEKDAALKLLADVEAEVENTDDDGKPVFELDETTTKHVKVRMNKQILTLIKAFDTRRQLQEEVRANHRNFNRMMTLVVAIVLGFIITYFFTNDGFPVLGLHHVLAPSTAKVMSAYSFVVTVLLDAGLALYALIRHY